MQVLKRSFYNRNTIQVAKNLLGCVLIRKFKNKIIKVIITETEAYRGFHDLASHAHKGKTERNKIMFDKAGQAYVYFIYGMHWMLNIVTEKKNFPAAVLIRGGDLLNEKGEMIKKLNGPAKLTKTLKINGKLNGLDITKKSVFWIERGDLKKKKIIKSKRIGVDYAKHSAYWKWNFRIFTNYKYY